MSPSKRWLRASGFDPLGAFRGLLVALGVLAAFVAPAISAPAARAYQAAPSGATDERSVPVGVAARIQQWKLPGSELEVVPRDDDSEPIVLRITGVFPHGTDHRYDFEFYGLDPGRYDLTDRLRRVDGSSVEDLPALEVEITSSLPPGQVEPNRLAPSRSPRPGGYRVLLIVAGFAWVAGLLAILFVGRRRRREGALEATRPVTLADRLRPLVEDAVAGRLPRERTAELERALLGYWRRRLGLEQTDAATAIRQLREHGEAGRLLEQLEIWLHRPGTSGSVDVAALLEPYRSLPADALETNGAGLGDRVPGSTSGARS